MYTAQRAFRDILFVGATSGVCYTTAAYLQNKHQLQQFNENTRVSRIPTLTQIRNTLVHSDHHHQPRLSQSEVKWMRWAREKTDSMPSVVHDIRDIVFDRYERWHTSQRQFLPIIAINAAVFLATRRLPTLLRHFGHQVSAGRSHTLLTSCWNHSGILHLGVNMYAGSSFAAPLIAQMGVYHFYAFYTVAGMTGNLLSTYGRVLLARIAPSRAIIATNSFSVGASGALLSCLALSACYFPDNRVTLVIPGMGSMKIMDAVYAVMAFDLAGIIAKFSLRLDHFGHLGGTTFGLLYARLMNKNRWNTWCEYVYEIMIKNL